MSGNFPGGTNVANPLSQIPIGSEYNTVLGPAPGDMLAKPAYTEEMVARGQTYVPGNALGGGLAQLDPATGQPYGADPNIIDPATGLPRGYMAGPGPAPGMPAPPILDMSQQTPAPQSLFQQPQTPPTTAQQIANPAPGAQQLINQFTLPPPRAALPQPPSLFQPQPMPQPQPQLQFPTPPRVNMDFLRQPGMMAPPPGQAPFAPPPRVNMDFLRAPAAQPRPAPQPVIRPAAKPVARPAPKPVAKPAQKINPVLQTRLNRLGR